jgi:beta-galactosidase
MLRLPRRVLLATLDRRPGQYETTLPALQRSTKLDILVENSGRVNYTSAIRGERKGITRRVVLGGVELKNWQIYSLPGGQFGIPNPPPGTL